MKTVFIPRLDSTKHPRYEVRQGTEVSRDRNRVVVKLNDGTTVSEVPDASAKLSN